MTSEVLVNTLVWAFLAVGSGLIGCLVWFAIRVVNQLDRLEKLVLGEIHRLDLRVTRIEAWRDGVMGRGSFDRRGHDEEPMGG